MSSGSGSGSRTVVKLFDAHCHLQDPRICNVAPKLIRTALDSGVLRFAVNGVSEKDWHVVKEMGEQHPSIIPCFGLHPWYVGERSPNWLKSMREFFNTTPSAAVGEIGLDKGSRGKEIDFSAQAQVFRQQLELAKELERPVSVHCVRAFGDLLEIMQCIGPFPAGVILHSYLGSAEIVPGLAKLGAYFSFSGHLMSLKPQKAKKMLKSVPTERILLESDAPDALPKSNLSSLLWVEGDTSVPHELQSQGQNSDLHGDLSPDHACYTLTDTSTLPKETLNHPANIHNVLHYVASLIEMPKEELAELSYRNAFEGQTSFLCKKLSNLHNLEQDIMENEHISGNRRDEIGSPKDLQKQNRNVLSMETAFPKYTSQQVQTGLHSSAHLLPQRFVGSLSK